MKQTIVFFILLLISSVSLMADDEKVPIKYSRKNMGGENVGTGSVERTPMKLPIEILYNTDSHSLTMIWGIETMCKVEVYDSDGTICLSLSAMQPTIDCSGYPAGIYTLLLEGDSWTGTGEFEIK